LKQPRRVGTAHHDRGKVRRPHRPAGSLCGTADPPVPAVWRFAIPAGHSLNSAAMARRRAEKEAGAAKDARIALKGIDQYPGGDFRSPECVAFLKQGDIVIHGSFAFCAVHSRITLL